MFKGYYLTSISWCINRHKYAAIMDYDFSKNVVVVYFCNDINHLIPKEVLINAFPWQILNPLKVLIVLIHLKVSILKYKIHLKVLTYGSILKYYVISQEGLQLHTYCNDNINYYGCYVFKFFLFHFFSFYVTWSAETIWLTSDKLIGISRFCRPCFSPKKHVTFYYLKQGHISFCLVIIYE